MRKRYAPGIFRTAREQASRLLAETDPAKITHDPKGIAHAEQAKLLVLMGGLVAERFNHLYAPTVEASQTAYDLSQRYAAALAIFPPLEQLEYNHWYQQVDNDGPLLVQGIGVDENGIEINHGEEFKVLVDTLHFLIEPPLIRARIIACGHVIINFLFNWCLTLTCNRARDVRVTESDPHFTISHATVKAISAPLTKSLGYHAECFDPLLYYVVDTLLLYPQTKLPFNITIPY